MRYAIRRLVTGGLLLGWAGLAPAATLLHYNFAENGGDTVTDLSGNGRHGTLGGFATTSANAGVFGASEGWVAGGGLSFLDDNVDCSYVTTPLSQGTLMNNGSFTIEFTASADGPNGWGPAIGRSPGFGPTIYFGPDGFEGHTTIYLNIGWLEFGTVPTPWSLPGDGSDPTRHHIAIVFTKNASTDGGVFEVFVNGISGGTWPVAENLAAGSPTFCIGNTSANATRNVNEQWDGVIYGVAFSDQPLAPSAFVLVNASLALNCSAIGENQPTGTTVGVLSTVGAGSGPFAYTLVEGAGDTGNAFFRIDGDTLKTAARFDHEETNSYSIRICSTGTQSITNTFTIGVTNIPEDYMMLAGAQVVAGRTEVGTLRTSGDYPTASYAITGGMDSNLFEWASTNFASLHMKVPPTESEIGRKYYVEVTATDSRTPVPNVVKMLIEAAIVPVGTPRKGVILLLL